MGCCGQGEAASTEFRCQPRPDPCHAWPPARPAVPFLPPGPCAQWNAGLGYTASDFQAAVFVNDANVVTGQYAHGVSSSATVGAEVAHNLTSKVTTFSAGAAARLACGGGYGFRGVTTIGWPQVASWTAFSAGAPALGG